MSDRWGRAGEPTAAERARRGLARLEREQATQRAYQAWRRGETVPHRITTALDLRSLYGPEVDAACGVEEPAVDEWEEGVRYPTWEQLLALADLTDYPVAFFVKPVGERPIMTDFAFHRGEGPGKYNRCRTGPVYESVPRPVVAFTPTAVAAVLGRHVAASMPTGERRGVLIRFPARDDDA